MNNNAYGTIAGLEKAHFGTTYGTLFQKDVNRITPRSRRRMGRKG